MARTERSNNLQLSQKVFMNCFLFAHCVLGITAHSKHVKMYKVVKVGDSQSDTVSKGTGEECI